VGSGDAARAARFAWAFADPRGVGREENQQLRAGSLLPARSLQVDSEAGGSEVGVLALKRLINSGPMRASAIALTLCVSFCVSVSLRSSRFPRTCSVSHRSTVFERERIHDRSPQANLARSIYITLGVRSGAMSND